MASLTERLSADLKDAMRAGDTTRRDEIRTLLALLKGELQTKLTRTLSEQHLIVEDSEATLTPEQEAAIERVRSTTALTDDEEQSVLLTRVKQHRQSIEGPTAHVTCVAQECRFFRAVSHVVDKPPCNEVSSEW